LDKQPHIALVTVWYPPRISVAVNRMDAFAHYLNLNGELAYLIYSIVGYVIKSNVLGLVEL
jgi:hypothetical protein